MADKDFKAMIGKPRRYEMMQGGQAIGKAGSRIWRLDTVTGQLDICEAMDVVRDGLTTPTVQCWKGKEP